MAAEGSVSSTAANQEYWLDLTVAPNEKVGMTFGPANVIANTILKISGVGFQTYYEPTLFQVSFICAFSNVIFGNKTTFGVVVNSTFGSGVFYHVECPVPVITMALNVTVSLLKMNGQPYPFNGFFGFNILTTQYYWDSITYSSTGNVTVTGMGFNVLNDASVSPAPKYQCVFTGKNTTNGTIVKAYLSPNAINLTTLDCGLTPSGYNIGSGISAINLTIYEANVNDTLGNYKGYQVQPLNSAAISLNACVNRVKDGAETGRMGFVFLEKRGLTSCMLCIIFIFHFIAYVICKDRVTHYAQCLLILAFILSLLSSL